MPGPWSPSWPRAAPLGGSSRSGLPGAPSPARSPLPVPEPCPGPWSPSWPRAAAPKPGAAEGNWNGSRLRAPGAGPETGPGGEPQPGTGRGVARGSRSPEPVRAVAGFRQEPRAGSEPGAGPESKAGRAAAGRPGWSARAARCGTRRPARTVRCGAVRCGATATDRLRGPDGTTPGAARGIRHHGNGERHPGPRQQRRCTAPHHRTTPPAAARRGQEHARTGRHGLRAAWRSARGLAACTGRHGAVGVPALPAGAGAAPSPPPSPPPPRPPVPPCRRAVPPSRRPAGAPAGGVGRVLGGGCPGGPRVPCRADRGGSPRGACVRATCPGRVGQGRAGRAVCAAVGLAPGPGGAGVRAVPDAPSPGPVRAGFRGGAASAAPARGVRCAVRAPGSYGPCARSPDSGCAPGACVPDRQQNRPHGLFTVGVEGVPLRASRVGRGVPGPAPTARRQVNTQFRDGT